MKRTISIIDEEGPPSSQSSTSSRRASASPSSKLRGQDLFDSRVFQNAASTTIFYQFIASLRQKIHDEVEATSSAHKFVRVLRDGGRLMRCYTQNIDGLEAREGLVVDLKRGRGNKRRFMKKHYEAPRPGHVQGTDFDGGCEVVQLHGDLDKLRCTLCAAHFEWTEEETDIYLEGAAPNCGKCRLKSEERQASGKRGLATGTLRPNIVLYGEDHPSNTLLTPLIPFDASCQPEVMVVMGTSLKVFGLQKIVREFAKAVHGHKNGKGRVVFVNRTRPSESVWEGIIDDFVAMDCDDWVDDLKKRRQDLWLRQGDLALAVSKPSSAKRKRKSVEGDDTDENRPLKKSKVTVEIPRAHMPRPVLAPSTPSRKNLMANKLKMSSTQAVRSILSPLAQAKRPPVEPFTSPLRFDDDDAYGQRTPSTKGTPKRPSFSPFSSPLSSGSLLRTEVFADENGSESENENENGNGNGNEDECDSMYGTPEDTSQTDQVPGKPATWRTCIRPNHEPNIVSKLWQRFKHGPSLSLSQAAILEEEEEEDGEDDCIEVETPSRGRGGRKVDVLAG
jgi:NAD-dependent SIR2 family protein deacetylase